MIPLAGGLRCGILYGRTSDCRNDLKVIWVALLQNKSYRSGSIAPRYVKRCPDRNSSECAIGEIEYGRGAGNSGCCDSESGELHI